MSSKFRPEGRYHVTTHVAVVLLVLMLFISVSYFFFLASPDEQARLIDMQSEFEARRVQWSNERPAAFRYVVDRTCNCPDEDGRAYLVTERPGERQAVFPIPVESTTGVLITVPPRPVWISDLFEVAGRALRSGSAVQIRYDAVYGFPEQLVVAPNDTYEIRDFEQVRENRQ
ncbi:MAG: DUF6174 domain-containing protein [Gammaproteobacteria bacterium]|nr:DUF6174 domain-containing protein [Gammaproteobacteria bacterium]MDH5346046.1 DUF6174 domain-containing protein [Gammaproteobacteria bacterium]